MFDAIDSLTRVKHIYHFGNSWKFYYAQIVFTISLDCSADSCELATINYINVVNVQSSFKYLTS